MEVNKILVVRVTKENLVKVQNEVREECFRRMRKELTGVVQGVSGKRVFFVSFQDRCEKDLTSNKLNIVKL